MVITTATARYDCDMILIRRVWDSPRPKEKNRLCLLCPTVTVLVVLIVASELWAAHSEVRNPPMPGWHMLTDSSVTVLYKCGTESIGNAIL